MRAPAHRGLLAMLCSALVWVGCTVSKQHPNANSRTRDKERAPIAKEEAVEVAKAWLERGAPPDHEWVCVLDRNKARWMHFLRRGGEKLLEWHPIARSIVEGGRFLVVVAHRKPEEGKYFTDGHLLVVIDELDPSRIGTVRE